MAAKRTFVATLRMLHLAITAGALFFIGVAAYSTTASVQQPPVDVQMFYIVAIVIVIAMPAIGTFFFRQRMAIAQTLPQLSDKLQAYRSAYITRIGFIDGAIIFPIVVALVTINPMVIGLSTINLLYLFFIRPTTDSVALDLALSAEEKEALEIAEA
jgi:hypothetical protein